MNDLSILLLKLMISMRQKDVGCIKIELISELILIIFMGELSDSICCQNILFLNSHAGNHKKCDKSSMNFMNSV